MSIPKGYKLVPVEPTREILEELTNGNPDQYRVMKLRWGQMLATAPQPIYDEAKERELFEASATSALGRDSEGYYIATDTYLRWQGWKDCAQSRAKAGEVGHE